MESALSDVELLMGSGAGDTIHEAVFERDAAGPPALEIALEWLGFACAGKRRALAFADESIDAHQYGRLVRLPVQIILPCLAGKDEFHCIATGIRSGLAEAMLNTALLC
jgi:hypothetical protein